MNDSDARGRLDGKVALVTGGARAHGQGAAEARLFAYEGATVVVTDVLDDEGAALAAEIGSSATYLHHDVRSPDDWAAVVARVIADHGRLDVLVNNAGIYHNGRIVDTDLADWQRVIDINQTGVFLGMQHGAQAMIDAGNGGAIVNISSVAGLMGPKGGVAYAASKWAVRGMTKVAAKELGRHGIRVNSVHPGLIETDMLDETPEARAREKATRAVPLGRFAEPGEVAALVLFLANDESSYCTGQEFTVDGGIWG